MTVSQNELVEKLKSGYLIGTPYSQLDCQAYVEKVMRSFETFPNYRGSNHMWREAVTGKKAITDWADVPAGAAVFIVRNDGGEKARGYNDNEGNATHVGFYLGDKRCAHSTTGGVQYTAIEHTSFTHYALWNNVLYTEWIDDPVITMKTSELHQLALKWLQEMIKEELENYDEG